MAQRSIAARDTDGPLPAPVTNARGVTVWLTGLSGAGKSTIATALARRLRDDGVRTEVLDGDEVRQHLSKGLGFSRDDRNVNIARIAYVAKLLTRNGVVVISAAISPYAEARAEARHAIGDFVEVFVDATVETCIKRDPKELYKKAIAGVIQGFTGISDPYEPPPSPELVIDTERATVDEGVAQVLALLTARGYLVPAESGRA